MTKRVASESLASMQKKPAYFWLAKSAEIKLLEINYGANLMTVKSAY